MAERAMVHHHWAHQDKKHLKYSDALRFEDTRLYSYSTVIGQVLSLENGKRVYLVNDGDYSRTTNDDIRCMLAAIPDSELIIPLHLNNHFEYGWNGVFGSTLTNDIIAKMAEGYVRDMIRELSGFKDSASASLETNTMFHRMLSEFHKISKATQAFSFTSLLKISEKQWHKLQYDPWAYRSFRYDLQYNDHCHAFLKAVRSNKPLSEVIDAAFGKGTYDAYLKRSERSRSMLKIRRLNIAVKGDMSGVEQIKKVNTQALRKAKNNNTVGKYLLSIKQHNQNIIAERRSAGSRYIRRHSSKKRFEKYLGIRLGATPWNREFVFEEKAITIDSQQLNVFHGIVEDYLLEFEQIADKNDRKSAIKRYRSEIFQHFHEESEARERLRLEREQIQKREATGREKMREYIQANQEQIAEIKRLYPENFLEILYHKCLSNVVSGNISTYHGGNVLMRWNPFLERAETSKGVSLTANECKRLWAFISRWHNNQTEFRSNTESAMSISGGNWSIREYHNDILIAGCHAIHYSEMEGVAKAIGLTK